MISERDVEEAARAGATFKQAILSAKYYPETDRVELVTPWCILIVDRQKIEELRHLSRSDIETISVSAVGIHVDSANIDINSAGLIMYLSQQLERDVSDSF
jgi:hypothetical protein